MKKAQIETIGLLIIVILIVMAGLFYLKFALKKSPVQKENKINNIQALNLINSVMNVQICGNETLKQTITLCENNAGSECCSDMDNSINTILDRTKDFKGTLYIEKNNEIIKTIPEGNGCETGIASPRYTFTGSGNLYESYFLLC